MAVHPSWTRHSRSTSTALATSGAIHRQEGAQQCVLPAFIASSPMKVWSESRLWRGHRNGQDNTWHLLQKIASLRAASSPLHWMNSQLNIHILILYFSRTSFLGLVHGEIPGCWSPSSLQGDWRNLESAIPSFQRISISMGAFQINDFLLSALLRFILSWTRKEK